MPLDRLSALAQEGRRVELEKMKERGAFEAVTLENLRGKKIGARRVEEVRTRPGGARFARCRLVNKEIAYQARDDVNAGTPPLCGVLLLISLAASWCRRGRPELVALHDAEEAYFHAWLGEFVCAPRPPAGAVPAGHFWQLREAFYATRRASQL